MNNWVFAQTECSKPLNKTDNMLLPNGEPSCVACAKDETTVRRKLPTYIADSNAPRHHSPQIAIQAKRQAVADLTTTVNNRHQVLGSRFCPGCSRKVLPNEIGTLLGPRATHWHRSCLRCGAGVQSGAQGCGKPLDSTATLWNDNVWCRSCSVSRGGKNVIDRLV